MRRTRDTPSSRTALAAVAIAAIALFVALGGPAYAAKLIDGSTIKAKSIKTAQLADGSVTLAKLTKSARTSLTKGKSPKGDRGPAGVRGPAGATGAKGHAGGFDVYDARNRRVGTFEGYYSSFTLVANDQGAIFAYDPTPRSTVEKTNPVDFEPADVAPEAARKGTARRDTMPGRMGLAPIVAPTAAGLSFTATF